MDIIRQRLFITHDKTRQRQVNVEYTIRSKIPELKNIFLNYDKFLPSLLIQDERGSTLPLLSSRDTEILYSYHIDISNNEQKTQLQNELNDIKNKKIYLIWISLKNKPIKENEVRTFTMTYLPEIESIKKPEIFIKFIHKNYPVYYSLFSPNNFNFSKPKFHILKNTGFSITNKAQNIDVFNSYQSLSLRITNKVDYDFGLIYSLNAIPDSKELTKIGAYFLIALPILFALTYFDPTSYELLHQKKIEFSLFIIGASLLLPNIQPDSSIRRELTLWYILPIIFGLLLIFL